MAREPIEQAGYISATSDIQQKSFLRNAAGPYIGSRRDEIRTDQLLPLCDRKADVAHEKIKHHQAEIISLPMYDFEKKIPRGLDTDIPNLELVA